MDSVVVSLGGSVLFSEHADLTFLIDLHKMINQVNRFLRVFIVVGGGRIARSYIGRGRQLGFSERELDLLGISVTRVNARFLSLILSGNKVIPKSTNAAIKSDVELVIMGGTTPGHSTDMVAAELAYKSSAIRLINATNVDYIYDKDPNQFSDAQPIKSIHIDKLLARYGTKWKSAGANIVIDGPSLGLIKKYRLPTAVVNGLHLQELEKAILGKDFEGTQIVVTKD